jgi:hypothetical protein
LRGENGDEKQRRECENNSPKLGRSMTKELTVSMRHYQEKEEIDRRKSDQSINSFAQIWRIPIHLQVLSLNH